MGKRTAASRKSAKPAASNAPASPPFLGAAYYPEDWPASDIDAEVALMREAGMNVMRIGEFAWSRMEPQEGQYDFAWLHGVVDKLGAAGIATILGTPTCTPPAWLTERYPEVLFVNDLGQRWTHGARAHFCPNSPVYREHCGRIVARLAKEFGRDPKVIGWQIDNEMFPHGRGCCCPVCHRKFQERLRAEFGSIEALNAAWGTDLWSQTYQSFSQIPFPATRAWAWHHPSLIFAWMRFACDSMIEYSNHQAAIIHRLARQPVGTDMMMTLGLSYGKTNRALDVVQHNHYHGMDNLWEAGFWFDLCRPLKARPFWNTETATCWNGGTTAKGYKEPGFCRANSWMPIALGGEANLYWLWRTHWSGQELMHGSVISSCRRPLHVFDEVKEIADGYRAAAGFLNGTRPVPAGLAIHASTEAVWLFASQPMVDKFDYRPRLMDRFYRPLVRAQFRMDVVDPSAELKPYKVVLSPFLPILDEAGLRERVRRWVEAGGTWIVGPLSDVRNLHGAKFTGAPYGSLEEWVGVRCKYEIPGEPRDFTLRWSGGRESKGGIWYDGLELKGAEALAVYTEGPLAGLTAVARRKIGRGQIVLLGTVPQPEDLVRMVAGLGQGAGVAPAAPAAGNLLVVPRAGRSGKGFVLVEHENKPAWIKLARPAVDLLTGKKLHGRVPVPPYGVMVLKT